MTTESNGQRSAVRVAPRPESRPATRPRTAAFASCEGRALREPSLGAGPRRRAVGSGEEQGAVAPTTGARPGGTRSAFGAGAERVFRCRVLQADGRSVCAVRVDASDAAAAARSAAANGECVLSVRRERGLRSSARRTDRRRLLELTEAFAHLLTAKLTVRDALSLLARGDDGTSRTAARLERRIDRGESFADAAAEEGVPKVWWGMVRLGERVGELDRVMSELARYLGDSDQLRQKTLGALLYPAVVLVVAIGVVTAIALFVVPRLAGFTLAMGQELPAYVARAQELAALFPIAIVVGLLAVGSCAVLVAWARTHGHPLGTWFDRFVLRVPLVGGLVRTNALLQLSFALETLTAGGVRVEDALSEAAGIAGNAAVADAVERAHRHVLRGTPLSKAIGSPGVIPDRFGRWVAIGERSGDVASVFAGLRAYYQRELERGTARIAALVEPILLVGLGGVVLLIVVVFVLPLFSMMGGLL